jgi:hypothetical protein
VARLQMGLTSSLDGYSTNEGRFVLSPPKALLVLAFDFFGSSGKMSRRLRNSIKRESIQRQLESQSKRPRPSGISIQPMWIELGG